MLTRPTGSIDWPVADRYEDSRIVAEARTTGIANRLSIQWADMLQQARPIPRTYGETSRHLGLKALAVEWALNEGFSFVAAEVSFPHRRFRVDVAACAPSRKTPGRTPVVSLSSVLKEAAVFECKQVRSDLIRDNKQRTLLSERLKTLETRRQRLEELLQVHLPHLANGESLFPQFDSYRLREHDHAPYRRLLAQIRAAKRGILEGTKFDRFVSYQMANLHYLVAEKNIIECHEVPVGWGLLVRREAGLELIIKPVRQPLGIEEQLIFLQRIAAKKSASVPNTQ